MGSKFNSIDDIRNHIAEVDEEPTETPEETPVEEKPVEETPAEPAGEETPAEEAPAEEAPAEEETPSGEEETPSGETPESEGEEGTTPEVYEPKLVYKSMGEEHKMDDFIAAAIQTPEQEEAIKRIYEKAAGLEHIEGKNKYLREQMEELQPLAQEGKELKTEIDYYNKLIGQKKHHELFKSINISDEDILNVAHTILQYKELTPQQQSVYDSNIQSNQRLHQLELQHNQLQQQVTNSSVSDQGSQLNEVLGRPDVQQAMSAYDTRLGEGSFKNEVINRAAMLEQQSQGKNVLTPEEAVNQVLKVIGHVAEPNSQQAASSDVVNGVKPQNQVVVPVKKPTLPNVSGGSKSPAKKVFKSIADLKKLASSLDEY